MVQKEIKNKARIYGAVGILSAMVLVAMIYSFGAAPQTLNQNPTPSAMPSATPITSGTLPANNPEVAPMLNFQSYEELNNFILNNDGRGGTNPATPSATMPAPMPTSRPEGSFAAVSPSQDSNKAAGTYSMTNIQVAGVDEADTVKTDGTYLYTIVNGTTVYILNAGSNDPQDAQVLSKITYENGYLSGIYLSEDGSKLAVLGNRYIRYAYPVEDKSSASSMIAPPYWNSGATFIEVYDLTNKASPVLARNFTMSGNYFNSRMIDDYVYAIVTETVYNYGNEVNLPIIYSKDTAFNIEPSSISYIRSPDSSYTYTSVISINILDSTQAPTNTTVMMGYTSQMYVSLDNIYVVSPTYTQDGQFSSIYRIGINQAVLKAQAQGSVVGTPINQYSMDEYNGNFRIATTTWIMDNATTSDGAVFKVSRQVNSIYVLNDDLNVIGKLEGFKMDEGLYAVRFMGEKCYVVTFKQIDPFFVIDMSNPTAPKVAGELKIPGYSSYLHPLDENHLIGIGKENNTLKLSLFDVSDINAPTETAKYIVEGGYTDSIASYDPHAFLYNPQTQQLIIPVSINGYTVMPFITDGREPATTSTDSYWQGVYIFKVNTSTGFELQGKVTQIDNTQTQKAEDYYWRSSNLEIQRALYIDNILYTISNGRVQLNSLSDFALLAKVNLN